jgi:hypothetical protein
LLPMFNDHKHRDRQQNKSQQENFHVFRRTSLPKNT